ncbi:MAG TPA: asparaginase domain-containing protein [Treponemataceae bacterium]|mgnify:CR=1 FL=1|nr:asparaginase domain-containing protein [Treponemataceae bacterium]
MYQSHVFLEVRILVSTDEKAFCSCRIGSKTGTCPICRRESGAYPVVNPQAARRAYTLAHALDCALAETAPYDKPKGSPSLPAQYSLSGGSVKIGTGGWMDIEFHRRKKKISIQEVRIEEDAGRLTHVNGETKMDYSRAGAPSIRIRTGADFELGEEAEVFLTELRRRIQYMGILKGVPPENVIRCNAYVALARYPDKPDYAVKLRNLNSFNFIRKAINAELHRQEEILISGGAVTSESRLWNERQDHTEFFQSRESASILTTEPIEGAPTYRCPPTLLAELRASAIEHPSERQNRLIATWGLSRTRAEFICDEKARADFFEETIQAGADAMETAHWLMSDVTGILRKENQSVQESPLSPKRFAAILAMYHDRTVNSRIAKQLLQAVVETDKDPATLLEEHSWSQITDADQLRQLVQKTIQENAPEAGRLREGDMAPLEFLTGIIMKRTRGLADPIMVKSLLKEELHISVVYVLAMGGTITGSVADGEITGGDAKVLKGMLSDELAESHVSFDTITADRLLSEEIQPADWAALIHAIASRIASGTANGIVVTHGTDTLAYTAPLVYWLFGDAPVPIVLTASNSPPAQLGPNAPPDEARLNLNRAIALAREKERGVYVVFGDRVLSPLNLKFLRPTVSGFSNWNLGEPAFTGPGLLSDYGETDRYVMAQILSEAADRLHVARVYPGMRADRLLALTDSGVSHFILELYERGTASMRESPYSLKHLITQGRKRGCRFFCTSQQEGIVDFSEYSTARRMWREGAVPMGSLTTETAVALYFAASLVCDTAEELDAIMESTGQG